MKELNCNEIAFLRSKRSRVILLSAIQKEEAYLPLATTPGSGEFGIITQETDTRLKQCSTEENRKK